MKLLFLGGTQFVGRHGADAAVAAGHDVTVLHRGKTGAGAVAGAKEILRDRMDDLSDVASEGWDAVVDTCGYVPRVVRHSSEALKGVGRYLFVSTISVYSLDDHGGLVVREQPSLETEEVTWETYGPLKVECEGVVRQSFAERATIVRPGLIGGPFDPTHRFTYWVTRISDGGEVLVSNNLDQPFQLIDARDLGSLMVQMLEGDQDGVYDATGDETSFGSMLATLQTALNPNVRFVPASKAFLDGQGLELWSDLPLTLPEASDMAPLMRIDCSPAKDAGLRVRPLADTAVDTLAWAEENPASESAPGLRREKEREALEALKQAETGKSAEA